MASGEEQRPQIHVIFMDLVLQIEETEKLMHSLPEVFHQ